MKRGKTNKQNGRARESETERQNESSNGRHGFGDRDGHLFYDLDAEHTIRNIPNQPA